MRASVSASLCGDLPDHSWWQATTCVSCGGLRTALGVALLAFVASRITCRPLVSTMVDHFSAAFGAPSQHIMAEHDTRTDEALSRLVSTVPSALAQNLSSCSATSFLGPRTPCATCPPLPCGTPVASPLTVAKRVEIPGIITACVDTGIQNELLQMQESEGSWGAHTRLVELGAAEADHTWLWWVSPHHGPEEYVDSVRLRLGCAGPSEPVPCAPCQTGSQDSGAAHSAAPWARPLEATTRPPSSSTPLLNPVTTPLRPRFLASFQAPISGRRRPHQRAHRPEHVDLLSARPGGRSRLHPIQARGQT